MSEEEWWLKWTSIYKCLIKFNIVCNTQVKNIENKYPIISRKMIKEQNQKKFLVIITFDINVIVQTLPLF